MHALPEKLSAHREAIEANVKRLFVVHEQKFNDQLNESIHRSEEAMLNQIKEFYDPKLSALGVRLDTDIRPVRHNCESNSRICQDAIEELRKDLNKNIREVNAELLCLRGALPPLHTGLQTVAKAVEQLEGFPPELQEKIVAIRADLAAVTEDLRSQIAEEHRRADAVEMACNRRQDRAEEKVLKAIQIATSAEEGRRVAEQGVEKVAFTNERLARELEELTKKVAESSAQYTARTAAFKEEYQRSLESLRRLIEQCNLSALERDTDLESRFTKFRASRDDTLEARLREHVVMTASTADEYAQHHAAKAQEAALEHVAQVRQEVVNTGEVNHQALEKAVEDYKQLVANARAAAAADHEALRQTHTDAQEQIANLVADAQKQAEQKSEACLKEAVAVLRDECAEDAEKFRQQMKSLKAEFDTGFQCGAKDATAQVKAVGEQCDASRHAAVIEIAETLRAEFKEGFQGAHKHANAKHDTVLEKLEEHKATHQVALRDLDVTRQNEAHEATVNLQARIASVAAESATRLEGTKSDFHALSVQLNDLRSVQEMQRRSYMDNVAHLTAELQVMSKDLEAAKSEAKWAVGHARSVAAEQQAEESASLRKEIVAVRQSAEVLFDQAKINLEDHAQTQERDMRHVSSLFGASSEKVLNRINDTEAGLTQEVGSLEGRIQELERRINQASTEAADARNRMKHETMVLATELTTVRASATSLACGVIRAIQVVGLLRNDIEVMPPKKHNGDSPHVPRRWGLEIADLLEWEKCGQPLVDRVDQEWAAFKAAGYTGSLLAIMEQKANERDLRTIAATLRSPLNCAPPWTASAILPELENSSLEFPAARDPTQRILTAPTKLGVRAPSTPLKPRSAPVPPNGGHRLLGCNSAR